MGNLLLLKGTSEHLSGLIVQRLDGKLLGEKNAGGVQVRKMDIHFHQIRVCR